MKHNMKTIREALASVTCYCAGCRDYRGVLGDAIGELEALRDATSPVPGLADSGPYTLADVEATEKHRGKPYARLRETVKALDAAKADAAHWEDRTHSADAALAEAEGDVAGFASAAARLREPLALRYEEPCRFSLAQLAEMDRAALSATDSAEWLAKHDAEVLRNSLQQLETAATAALKEQVDSLTQQLVAATNDAARAELRARDLTTQASNYSAWLESLIGTEEDSEGAATADLREVNAVLAAAPDSDARLREVLEKAIRRAYSLHRLAVVPDELVKAIIDEVLRGAA